MPFDEIHVDLKEQTNRPSNFCLLKLTMKPTKKGTVGLDHYLLLVKVVGRVSVLPLRHSLWNFVLADFTPRCSAPSASVHPTPHCVKSRTAPFVFTGFSSLSSFGHLGGYQRKRDSLSLLE